MKPKVPKLACPTCIASRLAKATALLHPTRRSDQPSLGKISIAT
jgi:hypothetical protein